MKQLILATDRYTFFAFLLFLFLILPLSWLLKEKNTEETVVLFVLLISAHLFAIYCN